MGLPINHGKGTLTKIMFPETVQGKLIEGLFKS